MKKTYAIILMVIHLTISAQTDCEVKLHQSQRIMESDALFKDFDKIFRDLLPCAEEGNPEAQNYIGLMYVQGIGVAKDEVMGLTYLERAAKSNNAVAQHNLGDLYREGRGCTLDMDKAIYWYQKSADNNNARAAYALGYMYMKGFGVKQDYGQAVSWYKKSSYAMAKHWLGVCYYLGYGVPQNTEKALEYLYSNESLNSKAFLENLKIDKRDSVLSQADQAIEISNQGDKKIDPAVIATSRETINAEAVENNALTTKDILGEWTGRFIEYDWSGTTPLRVLPIDITFTNNDLGELQTKIIFEGKTYENTGLFQNNNLFLNGFKFNLPQLYSHSFENKPLDFDVLGMDLSPKIYNNTRYLLVDVDSFIGLWREPGMPISLVLRPKTEVAITAAEDAAMLAMASQKAEFIKVYPVPFGEQLYIAFELANPAQVHVTLTSVSNANTVQVATTNLPAGMQSYSVNTAGLPNGYYVIRVQENEKLHTRIVIKK